MTRSNYSALRLGLGKVEAGIDDRSSDWLGTLAGLEGVLSKIMSEFCKLSECDRCRNFGDSSYLRCTIHP